MPEPRFKRPSAWTSPVATDGELWLRRLVVLQAFLPAPLLTLVMVGHLVLRGAGATIPAPVILISFAVLTLFELGVVVLWIRARRRSREILLRARFMICPACRYNLTASPPSGICPECGGQYDAPALRRTWEVAYWTGLNPPRLPDENPVGA